MDLTAINPAVLIASLMVAAVPIMLAAIGELVVEKAGVLNLGVEGMMIMGAVCGLAIAVEAESPVVGFVAAAAGGAALSLIFAFLTQVLLANQVATGLALTLFGLGLSSLIGQGYVGIKPPPTPRLDFGPLADIPVLGTILFRHDPVVYLSVLIIAAVWALLKFTRAGLILRAVGENHDAAHALGYNGGDPVRRGHGRVGRGLHQPGAGAAMDRRDHGRCRLDRAGHRGLCQLETLAHPAWCLSFRRNNRPSA